jgi:hypothetical protein
MRRHFYICLLLLTLWVGCKENPKPSQQQGADSISHSGNPATAPDTVSPVALREAFQQVVPRGFEMVITGGAPIHATGDLNGDGRADVALLLQNMDAEMPSSAIAVAHGVTDSAYQLGPMSGDFGPEPLHNPDPDMLAIEDEVLMISYQSMRWGVDLYFRSENEFKGRKGTGELWLIQSVSSNLGDARGDGTGVCTTDYLKGSRVSRIKRWDAQKGELIAQPEKKETVPTRLKLFSSFNEDSVYAEQ